MTPVMEFLFFSPSTALGWRTCSDTHFLQCADVQFFAIFILHSKVQASLSLTFSVSYLTCFENFQWEQEGWGAAVQCKHALLSKVGREHTVSTFAWPWNQDSLSTALQRRLVEVPPAAMYKDLQHITTLQLLSFLYSVFHSTCAQSALQTAIEKVQNNYVFTQRSCFLQMANPTLSITEQR